MKKYISNKLHYHSLSTFLPCEMKLITAEEHLPLYRFMQSLEESHGTHKHPRILVLPDFVSVG